MDLQFELEQDACIYTADGKPLSPDDLATYHGDIIITIADLKAEINADTYRTKGTIKSLGFTANGFIESNNAVMIPASGQRLQVAMKCIDADGHVKYSQMQTLQF